MSVCSTHCRFFNNFIHNVPVLTRSTHQNCIICNWQSVSSYSHRYCYKCAPIDSFEYLYHHVDCYLHPDNDIFYLPPPPIGAVGAAAPVQLEQEGVLEDDFDNTIFDEPNEW